MDELTPAVQAEEETQEEMDDELTRINRQLAEVRADLARLAALAERERTAA